MASSINKNSDSAFVSANLDICIGVTKDENEDEEETHQPTPTSIRSHEGGRSNIIHRQPRSLSNCVTMADVSSIEKSSPWDNAYDKFEATDEGDDLPTFTGKYPRLTTCPSNRAPRKGNHILQNEQIARTAKAQRKRIDRSRKAHKRFSPVPVDNEIAAFQQSHPAIWPKTSFAVRPKFSAGVKTKEKEGSTRKSKTKTLCIRTKS